MPSVVCKQDKIGLKTRPDPYSSRNCHSQMRGLMRLDNESIVTIAAPLNQNRCTYNFYFFKWSSIYLRRVGNGSFLLGLCCHQFRGTVMSGIVVRGVISWDIQGGLTPAWRRRAELAEDTNCRTRSISRITFQCAAKICLDQDLTGGTVPESRRRYWKHGYETISVGTRWFVIRILIRNQW